MTACMRTAVRVEILDASDGEKLHHLGDGGTAFSGLRRALSQVSMLVLKATTSGEAAWREELLKYASQIR
ncbi:hypothetical protein HZH66_008324 [Vespula vulgaris]|uniref:Uncharacterized protein n=1 Tax=Vespula vulgaris TaxID=7454 RepID=A0A834JVW0_VESVU|nr:hypothetical protein HZH66_008324 [Vespula vulgaris]